MDIHANMNNVDLLDDRDVRLIEQKLFAIFGPDSDTSELNMIIETFSGENRPKKIECVFRGIIFWVDLPD